MMTLILIFLISSAVSIAFWFEAIGREKWRKIKEQDETARALGGQQQ